MASRLIVGPGPHSLWHTKDYCWLLLDKTPLKKKKKSKCNPTEIQLPGPVVVPIKIYKVSQQGKI